MIQLEALTYEEYVSREGQVALEVSRKPLGDENRGGRVKGLE